nr:hypothetical protein [uncultured Desulfobacter sp.]
MKKENFCNFFVIIALSITLLSLPSNAKANWIEDAWETISGTVSQEIENCFSGGCDPTKVVRDFGVAKVGEIGSTTYVQGAAIMKVRHANNGIAPLSQTQKLLFRPIFGNMVDKVKIIYNSYPLDLFATFKGHYVGDHSDGQTFGYYVYITEGRRNNDINQNLLIFHELMHVRQYEMVGKSLARFGYHYFKSWARNGFKYDNIDWEKQAFKNEALLRDVYVDVSNLITTVPLGMTGWLYQQVKHNNWDRRDIENHVRCSRELRRVEPRRVGDTIFPGYELRSGVVLSSCDRRWELVLAKNGPLEVRNANTGQIRFRLPYWIGNNARLIMEPNGTLVLVNSNNLIAWQGGTGRNGTQLRLGKDGVIYFVHQHNMWPVKF